MPERGEEIEVTHHVRVVTGLVRVGRPHPRRQSSATWPTRDLVAPEISARWPTGWSPVGASRDGLREI